MTGTEAEKKKEKHDRQIAYYLCLPYRQFSNIRRTQYLKINVSRFLLQLSLPNPLKPRVKLRMKM